LRHKLSIKAIENVSYDKIIHLFSRYQHIPWSFLLDSCEQSQIGANFDIIGFAPVLTFEYKDGVQTLGGAWQSEMQQHLDISCPYASLVSLQNGFNEHVIVQNAEDYDHLPFIAGAMSAFGYDLNIQTDRIKDAAPKQYNLPDISLAFFTQSVIYDNANTTAYICAAQQSTLSDIEQTLTSDLPLPAKATFNLHSAWQSNLSKDEYCNNMQTISDYLHAGDCYQVNFAQRFTALYSGCEWSAYQQLKKLNQAPFSAFVRLPSSTILSVSPERFLSIKDGHVETKPIKGTRKRSSDKFIDRQLSDELLNSPKDKAENLMIVDLLRNDLSKHCQPHSVKVPALYALESYPAVHHLVSTVVGQLKASSTPYHLWQGAFPGGSITGAPKVRAMQIIQELEPDKRAIYCGSIGYVGIRNDMDSNICIRTLLAENGSIYCWAGGGIVIDSKAEDEYQESLDKVAKILPVLEDSK
jgi:para-aminobenzoate synthetase component 1